MEICLLCLARYATIAVCGELAELVEGGRLLIVYGGIRLRRGFESHTLRQ